MTSGTPSPADSPSLAQRPLLSSAAIVTTESSVVSTLRPSCESEQVCVPAARNATPAPARHSTPAPARHATLAPARHATPAPARHSTPAPARHATPTPPRRTETVRFEIAEDVADVSALDRPNRDFPER